MNRARPQQDNAVTPHEQHAPPARPDIPSLLAIDRSLDARLAQEHVNRLDDDYFARFDIRTIAAHIAALQKIRPGHPVEILADWKADGLCELTVTAFDHPGEFSLITGVLTANGFSIIAGDIFTYRPAEMEKPARRLPFRFQRTPSSLRRRRIVDLFIGHPPADVPREEWFARLSNDMREVILLLENQDPDAPARAKSRVNEMVTACISARTPDSHRILYPVEIKVDNTSSRFTRLKVSSQDTPAFLYSLSNALALHHLAIEHVRIRTVLGRVNDEIDIVTEHGRPITDPDQLDKIRLSVLLTKQFTYFLDRAPDPYAALTRFEQMVGDIVSAPGKDRWIEFLSDPHAMRDLAHLLGASDFLWEDFIRLQYESILPMLQAHVRARRLAEPPERLAEALQEKLSGLKDYDDKRRAINDFKDRQIFLIDLEHILNPDSDFDSLAEHLTALAETIVTAAATTVYERLSSIHGVPRTVAGLNARYAVMGLGKLGGAALGYASDIELLFVYSDSGNTSGPEVITNAEFFGNLARETALFIAAKREGIFHVDLRLRPYGAGGPLACSLESFCRYYGPGGPAHSYERLALVRMRAVGGDHEFGLQVERLRDEFIYAHPEIDLAEFRELRNRQFEEKNRPGRFNAKFSPGALVDLEYAVQILQVMHGGAIPALRTPRVREALLQLQRAGVLAEDESLRLVSAYRFLRKLINALRMLRGSARDLFLPEINSDEFTHLARRMGYRTQKTVTPQDQLYLDFETHTAAVRTFVQKFFGRDSIPGPAGGNVADLLLSEKPDPTLRKMILQKAGFLDSSRAYTNLRRLAGKGERRETFTRLAILACDRLRNEPDPDMALNNWERFVASLPDPVAHFEILLSQPRRLEILLGIFSRSQFLADMLISRPQFFDWVTTPQVIRMPRNIQDLQSELREASFAAATHPEWLDAVRLFRRREILRIGTRDMYLQSPMEQVVAELSDLADVILQEALSRAWQEIGTTDLPSDDVRFLQDHFCLLALGKLGGRELNYSSDIDLVAVYDDPADMTAERSAVFRRLMLRLQEDLTKSIHSGYVYRVDLRLRPYGASGEIASSLSAFRHYYEHSAAIWEIQALIKCRPVAGSPEIGKQVLSTVVHPLLRRKHDPTKVAESILQMRAAVTRPPDSPTAADVKQGIGGLRDIEFLVQGLQLIHAHVKPQILTGNTLEGLRRLHDAGIIPADLTQTLHDDYVYLRRIEHFLQIMEDRQIHTIPRDDHKLAALARRINGPSATAPAFLADLQERLARVHSTFNQFFPQST